MNNDILEIADEPTILYVDDQPSHLSLFKKAFEGDYNVLTASSPEEGLRIVKDIPVFLVIADHNMPEMTGIDFLQKAQSFCPKAIKALLSAYIDDKIVKEASKLVQVKDCLQKPWKLDRMRHFIEDAHKNYSETLSEPSTLPQAKESSEKVVPLVSGKRLIELMERVEESVDTKGAKRIFLQYVEPPLRGFVAPIQRAVPPLLQKAQAEVIKGNPKGAEENLVRYLQQMATTLDEALLVSPSRNLN